VGDYISAQDSKLNRFKLITGAEGEGKSTLAFQIIHELVMKHDWSVLYCRNPERDTALELSDIEESDKPVLIVVDNASIIAKKMYDFINAARRERKPKNVHLLLISVLSEWRKSGVSPSEWQSLPGYSTHFALKGIERDEASAIIDKWAEYGEKGLGKLFEKYKSSPEAAKTELHQASINISAKILETQVTDGALLGAIIKTRFREEEYKERVRLIMRKLYNMPLDFLNNNTEDTSVLNVFLRIAAMHIDATAHNNGKSILSTDIFEEIYNCDDTKISKNVFPLLGEEITMCGEFIYTRHTALADCAIKIAQDIHDEFYTKTKIIFPKWRLPLSNGTGKIRIFQSGLIGYICRNILLKTLKNI